MFDKVTEKFADGLASMQNTITNKRNVLNTSTFLHTKIDDYELRQIYKSGIGSKIVRIKAGYALNDTIQFETDSDETYFDKNLRRQAKRACRFMVGFGRGIVVNYYHGDDLSKPLRLQSERKLKVRAFSGDEVSVSNIERDFHADRYNKPIDYMVKGIFIHHTRVVDFTYVEPPEDDMTNYNYGGVSEFEMIHSQLIADGVVERASANIIEKNSSLFYKIKGFKDALSQKRESSMSEYFSLVEDFRSMNGATLMDAEDTVEVHAQTLTNLNDVSDLTLRRLAMVTGIPLSILVGENVKGLNSSGDNERLVFQDTIETVQAEYILEPMQELFKLHGLGIVEFKDNQGDSPQARIAYEKEVIANALVLWQMGEDYGQYLNDKDVVKREKYDQFFKEK
jgi:phage-related protein (TIGR01555 family)